MESAEVSSTNEWMKKMQCIHTHTHTHTHTHKHTMEYYSTIKKSGILPSATTWMDLEGIMLSEVGQTKTNIACFHLYVESKKIKQMNITKQKWSNKYRKQASGCQRGEEWGEGQDRGRRLRSIK